MQAPFCRPNKADEDIAFAKAFGAQYGWPADVLATLGCDAPSSSDHGESSAATTSLEPECDVVGPAHKGSAAAAFDAANPATSPMAFGELAAVAAAAVEGVGGAGAAIDGAIPPTTTMVSSELAEGEEPGMSAANIDGGAAAVTLGGTALVRSHSLTKRMYAALNPGSDYDDDCAASDRSVRARVTFVEDLVGYVAPRWGRVLRQPSYRLGFERTRSQAVNEFLDSLEPPAALRKFSLMDDDEFNMLWAE
jgi:hypothetical protein